MPLDVLPGCASLAVAADAATGDDDGFVGVSEGELIGHASALGTGLRPMPRRGKLAAIAELDRRSPSPEDAEFTADEIASALGESRDRAYELLGTAGEPGHPSARHQGGAAGRHGEPGQGPDHRHGHRPAGPAGARAAEAGVLDRAARLTRAHCAPQSPARSWKSPRKWRGNGAR